MPRARACVRARAVPTCAWACVRARAKGRAHARRRSAGRRMRGCPKGAAFVNCECGRGAAAADRSIPPTHSLCSGRFKTRVLTFCAHRWPAQSRRCSATQSARRMLLQPMYTCICCRNLGQQDASPSHGRMGYMHAHTHAHACMHTLARSRSHTHARTLTLARSRSHARTSHTLARSHARTDWACGCGRCLATGRTSARSSTRTPSHYTRHWPGTGAGPAHKP